MRKAFVRKLTELVSKNRDVYLLTGDLGFSVFDEFKEKFPDNYINVGLSEANMVGMAAGMAIESKQVFVYSIIPFVTFRVLEQIRNDLCEQNLPVKIVGVGEGLTYATEGPTHHAIDDIGVMTSLPNITVLSPSDPIEVYTLTEQSIDLASPVYMRLGRSGEEIINNINANIKIGKGNIIKDGKDIAIISTGNMVYNAIKVSEIIEKYGIKATVVSMHTIKPLDEDLLKKIGNEFNNVFVLEEHILSSGLGSKIAFFLSKEHIFTNLYFLGLPDEFVKINGKQEFLRKLYGLDINAIAQKIIITLKRGK
ncbi:MAG: transketolase family protein [Candidatus Micrarchaeia archaeon]